MSNVILKPIGDRLAAIATTLTVGAEAVKGYYPSPGMAGLAHRPAVLVIAPAGGRTKPDESERQLYTNDWEIEFRCQLVVNLRKAETAQAQMVELIETWVLAIDADRSLGISGLLDASVVDWTEPGIADDGKANPLLVCDTHLELVQFVASS
jgi:hypothetical protein